MPSGMIFAVSLSAIKSSYRGTAMIWSVKEEQVSEEVRHGYEDSYRGEWALDSTSAHCPQLVFNFTPSSPLRNWGTEQSSVCTKAPTSHWQSPSSQPPCSNPSSPTYLPELGRDARSPGALLP